MNSAEPIISWSDLVQWGKEHYRHRHFDKEATIPTRPGILYLVHQGAVRLLSFAPEGAQPVFLGIWRAGQPFTVVGHPQFKIQVYAQLDNTGVIWLYWRELQQYPDLYQQILEQFHQRHQSQLINLSLLGQKSTLQRLLHFLALLCQEVGEISPEGYCLPFPLTHSQIAQAIAASRVTVTRLLSRLQKQGVVSKLADQYLCINLAVLQSQGQSSPLQPTGTETEC